MRQFNTITAGELIEILQEIDPEAKVVFASDYGDHCRTQQVHRINGDINAKHTYESAYSDSGRAVRKDPEHVTDEDETLYVIS